MNKRKIGTAWEEAAAEFLTKNGYVILEKNFRCKEGEIDLVAKDGEYLVFVEVRSRRTAGSGHPLESVNIAKQRKICRVSRYYMLKRRISPDTAIRYDVISVLGSEMELVKNAFAYQA